MFSCLSIATCNLTVLLFKPCSFVFSCLSITCLYLTCNLKILLFEPCIFVYTIQISVVHGLQLASLKSELQLE